MAGLWIVVLLCVAAADQASTYQLAFKSCKGSGVQRCKVKAVEVSGCQKQATETAWYLPSQEDNYIDNRSKDANQCVVRQKSKLKFNITLHTSFSSSKLSSQFSVADYQSGDCSPASRSPGHCLFREYVRDGCRTARCPLVADYPRTVQDYLKINPDSEDTARYKRAYKIQWKLWNNYNKKENCCFTFALKYY